MIRLRYEGGWLLAEGGPIPFGEYDPALDAYRAPGIRYRDVVRELRERGVEFVDEALRPLVCPRLSSELKLRDYQLEALEAWRGAGCRGVIVLPTGAGKTVIALKAMEELSVSTLVVVPTLVLVEQWRERIEDAFGVDVGVVAGGREGVKPITVSTYDSASIRAGSLGNRFELLVFDEVHHLPSPTYSRIALCYLAPYRLGLTATPERSDGGHAALMELVGGVVYELGVEDLAGVYLAPYTIETVYLPLTREERKRYEEEFGEYASFLEARGIKIESGEDYRRLVVRSGRDPEVRRALRAREKALRIAYGSEVKLNYLRRLMREHPDEKMLIFTRYNDLVYRISREMLIPAITHRTPKAEREEILDGFREGRYLRIVTSRVLEEGVDVPDASIAVIISGTGSSREFIQRLGRILRKRRGKRARLIELVSRGTAEIGMSRRRRG